MLHCRHLELIAVFFSPYAPHQTNFLFLWDTAYLHIPDIFSLPSITPPFPPVEFPSPPQSRPPSCTVCMCVCVFSSTSWVRQSPECSPHVEITGCVGGWQWGERCLAQMELTLPFHRLCRSPPFSWACVLLERLKSLQCWQAVISVIYRCITQLQCSPFCCILSLLSPSLPFSLTLLFSSQYPPPSTCVFLHVCSSHMHYFELLPPFFKPLFK